MLMRISWAREMRWDLLPGDARALTHASAVGSQTHWIIWAEIMMDSDASVEPVSIQVYFRCLRV